jgi:hypothetical protein
VAPVADVVDVAPVAEVVDVAPVAEVVDVAPVAEVVDVAPVAELVETAPVAELVETAPVAEVVGSVPEALVPGPLPELSSPEAPVEVEPVRPVVDNIVGRVTDELGDADDLLAGVVGGGSEPPILEPPVLVGDVLGGIVGDPPGTIGSAFGELLPVGDVMDEVIPPLSGGSGGPLSVPALLTDLEPLVPVAPGIDNPSSGSDEVFAGSPGRPSPPAYQPAPAAQPAPTAEPGQTGGAGTGGAGRSSSGGANGHSSGPGPMDAPRHSPGASETLSIAMASSGAGSAASPGAEAADAGLPGLTPPETAKPAPRSPNAAPAGPARALSHAALLAWVTPGLSLLTGTHLAYTQVGAASAGDPDAGASGGSPPSPEPVTTGSGAASASSAAASAGLFALLMSLAALGLRYFARLQLAQARWRPQAFVAVLERPG